MEQTQGPGSTSSSSFPSLADILSSSQNQKAGGSRSGLDLLPSFEEFQKNFDATKESKLNFSRAAFGFGGLNFNNLNNDREEKPNIAEASTSSTAFHHSHKYDGGKIENDNIDSKSPKQNRKFDSSKSPKSRQEIRGHHQNEYSISNEGHREIIHLIKEIEKNKLFDFDGDEKHSEKLKPPPEFNLIRLPNDFKLQRGKINLYQSGLIEIVSGDDPPVIYRIKRAISNSGNVTTGLVITTDSQVYLDQMNICVPAVLQNQTKN